MPKVAALVVGLLMAWMSAGQTPKSTAPVLTVSAAVSLSEALEECAKTFKTRGGGEVRFNFAGSNVLARQIVNGAPADLFISADEEQMNVVERAGKIVQSSRVELLGNQLAVVATPERAALVREQFGRAAPEIRRLAIGDPAAVPAGVYARQFLAKQGLWTAYEPRVVPSANVRAALTAVETGSVDAAIVYITDAAVAKRAIVVLTIPASQGPKIVYPAAIVSNRHFAHSDQFLTFLRGAEASAIFARHKFTPLTSVGR